MPTYEYICKACGHQLSEFQTFSEPPLVTCPHCNTDNLTRAMGTGSGLIFKGTGFYLTDYKKGTPGSGPGVKKETPPQKQGEKE